MLRIIYPVQKYFRLQIVIFQQNSYFGYFIRINTVNKHLIFFQHLQAKVVSRLITSNNMDTYYTDVCLFNMCKEQ